MENFNPLRPGARDRIVAVLTGFVRCLLHARYILEIFQYVLTVLVDADGIFDVSFHALKHNGSIFSALSVISSLAKAHGSFNPPHLYLEIRCGLQKRIKLCFLAYTI